MKISICITVKNEEKTVAELILSLLNQSKKADEIIVVDGNSKDRTKEFLQKFKTVKVFTTDKIGIAAGRNLAISKAKNEIIVMTDAGCVPKKDWLEKITKPFARISKNSYPQGLLVAGFYEMPYITPLQQVMSVYHGVPPKRFNEQNFLPSARSVAFTKSVWRNVGKFDEHLKKAAEDTKFFYNCVKMGVKILRIKSARVVWKETSYLTLPESLKKFYSYAKGDAKIGIWWNPAKQFASHNIKISLIFIRYFIFFILIFLCFTGSIQYGVLYFLFGLYVLYPIAKWFDVISSWKGRLLLPFIQILSDFAVMAGFIAGSLLISD